MEESRDTRSKDGLPKDTFSNEASCHFQCSPMLNEAMFYFCILVMCLACFLPSLPPFLPPSSRLPPTFLSLLSPLSPLSPLSSLSLPSCCLPPHTLSQKVRYLGHWCRVPDGNMEPMELDHSPSSVWLRSNGVRFTEDGMTLEYDGTQSNTCIPRMTLEYDGTQSNTCILCVTLEYDGTQSNTCIPCMTLVNMPERNHGVCWSSTQYSQTLLLCK